MAKIKLTGIRIVDGQTYGPGEVEIEDEALAEKLRAREERAVAAAKASAPRATPAPRGRVSEPKGGE